MLLTSANAVRCGGDQLKQSARIAGLCGRRGDGRSGARRGVRHRERPARRGRPAARLDRSGPAGCFICAAKIAASPTGATRRSRRSRSIGRSRRRTSIVAIRRGQRRADPLAARRRGDLPSSSIDRRRRSAIAAISQAAADARAAAGKQVEVAEQPNDDALLALAATAVQQTGPEMNGTTSQGHELERAAAGRPGADHRRRRRCGLGACALPAGGAFLGIAPASRRRVDAQAGRPDLAAAWSGGRCSRRRRRRQDRRARERGSRRSRMRPQRAEGFGRPGRCAGRRLCRAPRDRSRRCARLSREPCSSTASERSTSRRSRPSSPPRTSRCGSTTSSPNMRRLGPTSGAAARRTAGGPDFRRELGSLVEVHPARAGRRSMPDARYSAGAAAPGDRRCRPGARRDHAPCPAPARASDWVGKARRYVAAHRALDEIESAALLGHRRHSRRRALTAEKRLGKRTRHMRILHVRAQRGFSRALLSIWQTGESCGGG